jgi:hypothetical protein
MTSAYLPEDLAVQVGIWSEAGLRSFDTMPGWLPWYAIAVTAAYTVQSLDRVILANATAGAFTVTLPTAVDRNGQQPITIKRVNGGANAVTIGSTSGTIDGSATASLASQYSCKTVISDGTNWHVVMSF